VIKKQFAPIVIISDADASVLRRAIDFESNRLKRIRENEFDDITRKELMTDIKGLKAVRKAIKRSKKYD